MSRVGKQPLPLPSGVKVHVADGVVRVEGPKGKLERRVEPEITVAVEGNVLSVRRSDDSRRARSLHGLTRKLLGNMVEGAANGFRRVLEINGVGYRAEARGNVLFMTLGFSHPIAFQLPAGITAKVERQVVVTIEGPDREVLGETLAAIRELRPPEPYKGKGVKYAEETIRRKAGKAAAGGAR
jgi:large subunit ribosomal protein L6